MLSAERDRAHPSPFKLAHPGSRTRIPDPGSRIPESGFGIPNAED
jgi:hypothetical protein